MSRRFDPFHVSSSSWIFHCDADAFYAACHMAEDQRLTTNPVVICGDPSSRHGVIVTANYLARAQGIHTGMLLYEAQRLCPDVWAIKPDKALYRLYSQKMHAVFSRYATKVEPLALDEAWLEMGPLPSLPSNLPALAQRLQQEIQDEAHLSVSIGISSNKMLAKQVSDWSKPHGITQLLPEEIPQRLWPREIAELFGCGPAFAQKLQKYAIKTIGDLAQKELAWVLQRFGQHGLALYLRARGEDFTPVIVPQRTDRRSVSAEHTSRHDLHSAQEISALFAQCAQEVSARSQEIQLVGNRVGIKWRTKDFHTYSKQTILPQATNDPRAILRVAWQLWQMRGEIRPIRLIGITLSGLQEPSQQMHFSF